MVDQLQAHARASVEKYNASRLNSSRRGARRLTSVLRTAIFILALIGPALVGTDSVWVLVAAGVLAGVGVVVVADLVTWFQIERASRSWATGSARRERDDRGSATRPDTQDDR